MVITSLDKSHGGFFFVYGYGGTGKTFLWNTLSLSLRAIGDIVLIVASSGIAATLLPSADFECWSTYFAAKEHGSILSGLCNGTRLHITQLGRVKSMEGLTIVFGNNNNADKRTTRNVVYQEVF
ncbi:hypothetical protein K1719_027521 [Acacia pycnantha]|nr:hypothetical protein K1719_027521 [Acacia pycnantha]